MTSNSPLHGTIHGKTIELSADPGMADGQEVEVILRPAAEKVAGGGFERMAGLLADSWSEEDDAILEQIMQDRQRSTSRDIAP